MSFIRFNRAQRCIEGLPPINGISVHTDESGSLLPVDVIYWQDGTVTDPDGNTVIPLVDLPDYAAVESASACPEKSKQTDGKEFCYEQAGEEGFYIFDAVAYTTSILVGSSPADFLSEDTLTEAGVIDLFSALFPSATITTSGLLDVEVDGDVSNPDWAAAAALPNVSQEGSPSGPLTHSGDALNFVDFNTGGYLPLDPIGIIEINAPVAGGEGKACKWFSLDEDGNPDPATIEWRDGETLELVLSSTIYECEAEVVPVPLTLPQTCVTVDGSPAWATPIYTEGQPTQYLDEVGNLLTGAIVNASNCLCECLDCSLRLGIDLQKTGLLNGASAGDTIAYSFRVENTGEVDQTNVTVSDPLVTIIGGPINLAVGEVDTTSFTAIYTLTQEDVDRGFVENQATVTGDTPNGPVSDVSDDPLDTTSDEDDTTVTIVPPAPNTFITKTVSGGNAVGEEVIWTLQFGNSGNVTLTAVVDDSLFPIPDSPYTLEPGEVITLDVPYIIQPGDPNPLVNTATITATDPSGTVVTDTDTASQPLVVCTKLTTGSWTVNGQVATSTLSNGNQVRMTFGPGVFGIQNGVFNTPAFWSEPVNGQTSLSSVIPFGEFATIDFLDSGGSPITADDVVVHFDRIGGSAGGLQNGALVTLLGGNTWTELAGTSDFETTATTAADLQSLTGGAGAGVQSGDDGASTAAGSVQVDQNGISSVQLAFPQAPTSPVGGGLDGIEFGVTAVTCV